MLMITDEQSIIFVLEKGDARSHIGLNMLFQTQLADRCQMQLLSAPQPAYDLNLLRKSVDKHLTSVRVVKSSLSLETLLWAFAIAHDNDAHSLHCSGHPRPGFYS